MKLFCENRNKFYNGEDETMTFWDKSKSVTLSKVEAEQKTKYLKQALCDSDYIIVVEDNFKAYN